MCCRQPGMRPSWAEWARATVWPSGALAQVRSAPPSVDISYQYTCKACSKGRVEECLLEMLDTCKGLLLSALHSTELE